MQKRIQIGLVGDFSEKIKTLVALNESITHCRPQLNFTLETFWIPTEEISDNFLATHTYEGFWLAPGSPYKDDEGVYKLIQWSRENNFPLYGVCGGFQYMLIEYARNVVGIPLAGHEESEPHAKQLIVSKLSCSLKGQQEDVLITDPNSWLAHTLQTNKITGNYYCNYGLNPIYQPVLNKYPMVFTAYGPSGETRAFELRSHRFYSGTLFQPSLDSTPQKPNPLIVSFFKKCAQP